MTPKTGFRYVVPIAGIYACRMLGLFLLIPIFALYAKNLADARPALIGIALGAYGLSQGLLQIPFGLMSDKVGRKPMILIGLLLFAAGSLIGAQTHSIYGVILARTLQGMGAIGSVLMAFVSDLTPPSKRTPAMAIIGASIGLSFNIALILSPWLAARSGLNGIFYLTFALAILGMLLLANLPKTQSHKVCAPFWQQCRSVLSQAPLKALNLGIFCQHFVFTATFFVLPLYIRQAVQTGIITTSWHFYLPTILLAFILAVPSLMIAEKKNRGQLIYLAVIGLTGLTQMVLFFAEHIEFYCIWITLFVYFFSFNALEALLPSMVSKVAQEGEKGTAMGVYSTSQFLGIFAGGTASGIIAEILSVNYIFTLNFVLLLFWFRFTLKNINQTS